jgi:hypothetical protein
VCHDLLAFVRERGVTVGVAIMLRSTVWSSTMPSSRPVEFGYGAGSSSVTA